MVFKDHPYAAHSRFLKEYYFIEISFHLSSLVQHLINSHENDFIEMVFHHMVTLYLMFGSYMMNVWECGAVISFLHDACDVAVFITKTLSQTDYEIPLISSFAWMLLSWGWFRKNIQKYAVIPVGRLGKHTKYPIIPGGGRRKTYKNTQ